MASGISLANKCQLLFGAAVVTILGVALAVPWVRTQTLVRESQLEVARQLATTWLENGILLGRSSTGPIPIRLYNVADIVPESEPDAFIVAALRRFESDPADKEYFVDDSSADEPRYRYARAIRESQWTALEDRRFADFSLRPLVPAVTDPLRAILVIDRRSDFAAGQMLLNRVYIVATGIVGSALAILVFYFILTKLILSPVRGLRETAEKVRKGDLTIRSSIHTGDDFEQLSDAFNTMLDQVQKSQEQLRTVNENLDLKVTELSEANIGLFESNRLKSEFLANVSHELRTPLNSIIGFAELLDEMAKADTAADPKRLRYLANILASARSLLDMINELLEMAKIEAGRMAVSVEAVSVPDIVEGLQTIMRPQAEAKRITVAARIAANLPVVETDPGKLQQILYNFMSNAIKFSPAGESVTIAAERVTRQDSSPGVRLSVADRGPGIPYDMQDTIFEKFRQVDASHTREYAGTGLGLAICRELAELLGATVSLVSEPGHGATFFVELPLVYRTKELQPLMA